MKNKFKEIRFEEKNKNPFQGADLKNWCTYAMAEYERWRMTEIIAAHEENLAVPPLLETNYELVSKWVKK